ncbi:glycosyltransferase family 2 protein [Pantoea dispersa]|uniref:glycosyltransferase family 2 protein n=1 Tax=Pantoea dispersa TaxID=59814 RepID=UPI00301ABDFE
MMVPDYLISVLLTAHNSEKFLPDTLASLEKACHGVEQYIEFILINDASVDNTAALLDDFSRRHPQAKVFNIDYRNIGRVRNFGVQQCSGEYITMLDGDDQLLADALADIVRYLKSHRPDALFTALNEVYESRPEHITWQGLQAETLSRHQAIEKFLIHRDLQAHFIGQFIKRTMLLAHPFPDYTCYEDAWLFPEILVSSDAIAYSRQSPYLYFKRGNSLSSQLNKHKISLLVSATQHMDEVLQERYRNLLSCHWINIAHKHREALDNPDDRKQVIEAITKIRPLSFLFDSKIRTSFKKKYLALKLNNPL